MCQGCIDSGRVPGWLAEIIDAFDAVYDEAYGPAHIVIDDWNLELSHIRYCLDATTADGPWRPFLNWLLTIPEKERVPLGPEFMEPSAR